MSKNLTWLKPNGEWGIEGVDLTALPPKVYGALAKLMRLEHPLGGPAGGEPSNDPLTLEELREMDGEPVWVVESPDWGHWELSADAEDYVQDRDTDFYGMRHDDPHGKYGLHALGWLAYRRKPEDVSNSDTIGGEDGTV